MIIFDHAYSKIIESTFSFSEFVPACKKISLLHLFIFKIKLIFTRLAAPIFDHAHPKNFQATFIFLNLYQHTKNQLIPSVLFSDTVNFKA